MSEIQSDTDKLFVALIAEREAVLADFTQIVKAELIKHARTEGALHWIEQYTKFRRQLGYLNRLPQELGRYADSIEGLVRAHGLLIGLSTTLPMQKVEEWFYAIVDKIEGKGVSSWYVEQTSNYNYMFKMLADNYQKILFKNTVPKVAKTWIKAVHLLLRSQTDSILQRLYAFVFNPMKSQLKEVAHVRGLATILKSEEFQHAVKKQLKEECLTAISNIEIRVLGQEKQPVGVVVVPDVEEADKFIRDFISDTGVMRNVAELAARFPELKEASEQVSERLEKIKKKMDALETTKSTVP